jgi:hypothetical protein
MLRLSQLKHRQEFIDGLNRYVVILAVACSFVVSSGCRKDTTLHTVSGKVTLGGKPYNRLIVYFRPISAKVTEYNMGVGETDAQGTMTLRSTAGNGLIQGKYRVAFSHLIVPGAREAISMDQKQEMPKSVAPVEKVPEPYADWENSPVVFEVKANDENYFEYDIPLN